LNLDCIVNICRDRTWAAHQTGQRWRVLYPLQDYVLRPTCPGLASTISLIPSIDPYRTSVPMSERPGTRLTFRLQSQRLVVVVGSWESNDILLDPVLYLSRQRELVEIRQQLENISTVCEDIPSLLGRVWRLPVVDRADTIRAILLIVVPTTDVFSQVTNLPRPGDPSNGEPSAASPLFRRTETSLICHPVTSRSGIPDCISQATPRRALAPRMKYLPKTSPSEQDTQSACGSHRSNEPDESLGSAKTPGGTLSIRYIDFSYRYLSPVICRMTFPTVILLPSESLDWPHCVVWNS